MLVLNKWENNFKQIVLKYKSYFFLLFVSIVAILIRYSIRNFTSEDYTIFLHPWYETIRHMGGISALKGQVGNYNILYQLLIALLTYLPLRDAFLYKIFSCFFDFLLAIGSGWLVSILVSGSRNRKRKYFIFTYTIILLLPTVILNSAAWAQCDSIYTTFVIFSLVFFVKNNYVVSFIMLGLAFGFKLQTIYILPFFLLMWLIKNKVYIWHFLIMIFIFWLTGLPGYINGRSLLAPFKIYLNQANSHNYLFMNYYNFSGLIGRHGNTLTNFYLFEKAFIFGTILVIAIGYMYLLYNNSKFKPEFLIDIATWTVYTCAIFLPAVHERYAYLVDVLIIVMVFVNKKYLVVAIPEVLNSLLSYNRYLFSSTFNVVCFSYIALITYIVFTVMVFNYVRKEKK